MVAVCGSKADQFDEVYREAVLMVGQKGGKNWTVEILVDYYLYKLANLINPHEFFNVDKSTDFNICNSSMVNERQAKGVFFERMKNTIRLTIDPKTGDNWFERYAGLDLRPGGFGDMQSKNITFPEQGPGYGKIKLHCFDSTPSSPEGLTIFLAIMDEPSRANTIALYDNANKLYRMYSGNIQGSFKQHGKLCIFSYPEQELNDLTVERYNEGLKDPKVFVMKAPTWEFNPKLTREDYDDWFRKDPIDAACRFGCVIPANKFGFFKPYFEKIEECVNPELKNRVQYRPTITRRQTGKGEDVNILEFTGIEILNIMGDDKIRVWAGDPAISGDAFVFAGGYAEYLETDGNPKKTTIRLTKVNNGIESEEEVILEGKIVIDTIIVWKPEKDKPVDYVDVENVILKLLDVFPMSREVHFDKFNSEGLRQKILQKGLKCESHAFSQKQQLRYYKILRGLIWNNQAEYLPEDEYRSNQKDLSVITELRQLILENRTRIQHPSGGSKDIADVFAMLAEFILKVEFLPTFKAGEMDQMEYSLEEYARRYLAGMQQYKELNGRVATNEEIAAFLKLDPSWIPELKEYISDPIYHYSETF